MSASLRSVRSRRRENGSIRRYPNRATRSRVRRRSPTPEPLDEAPVQTSAFHGLTGVFIFGWCVAYGALGHAEFAEKNGAGPFQPLNDGRGIGRDEILVDEHAGGGRGKAGVAQVLHGDRHAMQRASAEARAAIPLRPRAP